MIINVENKKYSVMLCIGSFFGILLSYLLSHEYFYVQGSLVPVDYFGMKYVNFERVRVIDIFGLQIQLKNISIFWVLLIALSIYLFLYKTDEGIKNYCQRFKGVNDFTGFIDKIRSHGINELSVRYFLKKVDKKVLMYFFWVVLFVIILILSLKYYDSIVQKERNQIPLTWFEAFYSSYAFTIFIIVLIGFIRQMLRFEFDVDKKSDL